MREAYLPQKLPDAYGNLDYSYFFEELIDANSALDVYMSKLEDGKVDSTWFLPILQANEAVNSLSLEGTQTKLDDVLADQIDGNDTDKNNNEVINYINATTLGIKRLKRSGFDHELIKEIHNELLRGNVRKQKGLVGDYRSVQNYIKRVDGEVSYVPPKPEHIQSLMDNLIQYMNNDNNPLRPLVRIAIVHGQFESIHPFEDSNGRVGRILIPLYLYSKNQIALPFLFISETLERDKYRYYGLLNNIRDNQNWNDWIKFFLDSVTRQCKKYTDLINRINALYEDTLNKAGDLIKTYNSKKIVEALFRNPISDSKLIQEETNIPLATLNRNLKLLLESGIIFSDGKSRNRKFFFYDLLALIRD